MPRRLALGALLAVSALATACGGQGDTRALDSSISTSTQPTAPTTSLAAPSTTHGPVTVPTVPALLGALPPAPTVTTPVRLRIDAIGVDAAILPVGVEPDGGMEVPGADDVGWYRFGPSPGADGSSVLAAHVDLNGRRGVFFRIRQLPVGARVEVTMADGSTRAFRVNAVGKVPKGELGSSGVFDRNGEPRLALVTCGGDFDRRARSYRDNVVALAESVT
jgi:hypothetical protein